MLTVLLLATVSFACSDPQTDSEATTPVTGMLSGESPNLLPVDGAHVFLFPDDHGPHNKYGVEWWHMIVDFTDTSGKRYGAQLTFFRIRVESSMDKKIGRLGSTWNTNQLYMAHFALTDVSEGTHLSEEKFQRGGDLQLAGAKQNGKAIWLNNWTLQRIDKAGEKWRVYAETEGAEIELELAGIDKPILHGSDGYSFKGAGNVASYYYSLPNLSVRGTLTRNGASRKIVDGNGWIDREWSNGDADSLFAGWIWLALWLDNDTQLMVYRVFRNDETGAVFDYAATISSGGISVLPNNTFTLTEERECETADGAEYTCELTFASHKTSALSIRPLVDDQSHKHNFRYWEGLVDVYSDNGELRGSGYLENTLAR